MRQWRQKRKKMHVLVLVCLRWHAFFFFKRAANLPRFFFSRRREGMVVVVWLGGVESFASSAPAALIASRFSSGLTLAPGGS